MARTVTAPDRPGQRKPAQRRGAAPSDKPSLAQIQASFQRALMTGDDAILGEIVDSPRERREVLLGVYQNAYIMRLIGFVKADYPALAAYVGTEAIERIGRAYFASHPSRDPNARWASGNLPEFLSEDPRYAATPTLADLARLERALANAFDAMDCDVLRLEHLAAVAPEDWPRLAFTPQPCVHRLTLGTNAVDVWRAVNAGTELPEPAGLDEPLQLVAYRRDLASRFRELPYDEAMAWDEMVKGNAFGGICEMLAMHGGEADAAIRAANLLKGWIDEGMLVAPEN